MGKNLPWIFLIVAISTFCVLLMQRDKEVEKSRDELIKGLHLIGLDKYKKIILNTGIENLVQLVTFESSYDYLSQLNPEDKAKVEISIKNLKELLILQQWLEENSVTYPQRLLEKLGSLDVIAKADDGIIAKVFGDKIHNWHHAKRKLSTDHHEIKKLKSDLWENFLYANSQAGWSTGQ